MYPGTQALFWSTVGTLGLDAVGSAVGNSTVVMAVVLLGAPRVIILISINVLDGIMFFNCWRCSK